MGRFGEFEIDIDDSPLLSDDSWPEGELPEREVVDEDMDETVKEALDEIFNEIDPDEG